RFRHAEATEEHAVDQAEGRRAEPYAQGQGNDGNDHGTAVLPQGAESVLEVLDQRAAWKVLGRPTALGRGGFRRRAPAPPLPRTASPRSASPPASRLCPSPRGPTPREARRGSARTWAPASRCRSSSACPRCCRGSSARPGTEGRPC